MNKETAKKRQQLTSMAMGETLRMWRLQHSTTINMIAREEGCRYEAIEHVERGTGNMRSLTSYLNYINEYNEEDISSIIKEWQARISHKF